jgi:hypothetical protein
MPILSRKTFQFYNLLFFLARPIPFYPWVCFFIFLISNTCLSFLSLVSWENWIVFLIGIFLPIIWACRMMSLVPRAQARWLDESFSISPWFWASVLLMGFFLRFYQLTQLSLWPLLDESQAGFFGMELKEKWTWNIFYGDTQLPPFFFWALGGFFKFFQPSLTSLWLFSALSSFSVILLNWYAIYRVFSQSMTFICVSLLALVFWPVYLGRFAVAPMMVHEWEYLILIPLFRFLKTLDGKWQKHWVLILGISVGLGFYTYLSWCVVALFISLIVVEKIQSKKLSWNHGFLFFFVPCGIIILPFILRACYEGYGSYLGYLWAFHENFSWIQYGKTCKDFVSGLFWGVHIPLFAYKPFWGGLMDPVTDSLFCLGGIGLCQKSVRKVGIWIMIGLFLFSLPALLTRELEFFRWVLILPLILGISALGLQELLIDLPWKLRRLVLGGILLSIGLLGAYHLFGPYRDTWRNVGNWNEYSKSYEKWKAYQVLNRLQSEAGPGWILTEFESSSFNPSLAVATYSFNAARNPFLAQQPVKWAAFMTNINYLPFLFKRFSQAQWFYTSLDPQSPQNVLLLVVVPLDSPKVLETFQHWLQMDRALEPETSATLHLSFHQSQDEILRALYQNRSLTKGDPFLESCLDEKIYFHEMSESHPLLALQALRWALTSGYPAAHLYNDLGVLWFTLGDNTKARQCFLSAIHSPMNHTTAAINLRRIP